MPTKKPFFGLFFVAALFAVLTLAPSASRADITTGLVGGQGGKRSA